MLRLSRSFLQRRQLAGQQLPEKFGDIKDTSSLTIFMSHCGFSTARPASTKNGNYSPKTYADFSIFKGKAALSMTLIPPKFSMFDTGYSIIEKKGAVMLKFMPSMGVRKYDSQKRQLFALSATEVGSLISLGPNESCEFLHDPFMKSSKEGQVKKTLTVSPTQDGSGYFFNLSVALKLAEKTPPERFSVLVTKAEFAVMRTAFGFALPHIMGWDKVVTQARGDATPSSGQPTTTRVSPAFEWGR